MNKKNWKLLPIILMAVLFCALLSGCVPGDGSYAQDHRAGFFMGIWHGWIAPISLIISIFRHSIHIYEPYNTGFWYDFGFYMAVISGFGGLALSRRNARRRNHTD